MRLILKKKIRPKIRPDVSYEQFGFVSGKGTSNAFFLIRVLTKRALEMQKNTSICVVDYGKASDKFRHVELSKILKEAGLDGGDHRLMRDIYWKQKASVRVGIETSMSQEIKRCVRQGCVLSSEVFNLYSEIKMKDITSLEGIKFGGTNINNQKYADDTTLVADSGEKLKCLFQALVQASEEQGL